MLPVSDDYDAFVRPPSGVIEREFGPFLGGAFRLDVSGEFGGGPTRGACRYSDRAFYTTGSAGPESGPTSRATGVGTETDQEPPATMAEMLAAGA